MNSAKIARITKPRTMAPPTMPTGLSLSSATGLSDAMTEAPSRLSGVLGGVHAGHVAHLNLILGFR